MRRRGSNSKRGNVEVKKMSAQGLTVVTSRKRRAHCDQLNNQRILQRDQLGTMTTRRKAITTYSSSSSSLMCDSRRRILHHCRSAKRKEVHWEVRLNKNSSRSLGTMTGTARKMSMKHTATAGRRRTTTSTSKFVTLTQRYLHPLLCSLLRRSASARPTTLTMAAKNSKPTSSTPSQTSARMPDTPQTSSTAAVASMKATHQCMMARKNQARDARQQCKERRSNRKSKQQQQKQ